MPVPEPTLTLGVVGTSRKPDERRLPLHPRHLERVPAAVRARTWLETGYGELFGVPDSELAPLVAGLRPRAELIATSDVVLLPKPVLADVEELRAGQVLWGWPHCVQDPALTQAAIDRRLTLLAWEAMNHWTPEGSYALHVFHKNNELAGYCSVLHALTLVGRTGHYGRRLRAAVLSFGATARGAVTALEALGIHDVAVVTQRYPAAVMSPLPGLRFGQFERDADDPRRLWVLREHGRQPMPEFLAEHDVVVNCVLQDTDDPLDFLDAADLPLLAAGTLVVDVSCDTGMGFSWARPTSFADPMRTIGDRVHYYAVDHSPTWLWDSASWEISEALIPYLPAVLDGPAAWEADDILRHGLEIVDGVVRNPKILSFQGREAEYPHRRR